MRSVEFGRNDAQAESRLVHADAQAESRLVHVVWLTSGLGCDGDSVAMTSATSPSLEDLWRGILPGMPQLAIYNAVLAYETGDEFMTAFWEAAAGRLDPFVLVLEGSVANEALSGEGHWSAMGVDPVTGQPVTTDAWLQSLAPRAGAVLALGTCAAYGGVPAMRGNPTGAMGLRDWLGAGWRSRLGLEIVNLPGCPVLPDNITETLLALAMFVAGTGPAPELDAQGRPAWLFGRTVQQGCGRAGYAEQGEYASSPADARGCLVKLGCKGPVSLCNVPVRGWTAGVGGCPNVGGICIGCTMPGFPDRFMPFIEPSSGGLARARARAFTYGPLLRRLRRHAMQREFDREPGWRRPGDQLASGYEARW
jgi:hydrogenase small subunit